MQKKKNSSEKGNEIKEKNNRVRKVKYHKIK